MRRMAKPYVQKTLGARMVYEKLAHAPLAVRQRKGLQGKEHRHGMPVGEGGLFAAEQTHEPSLIVKRKVAESGERSFPRGAELARIHVREHAFLEGVGRAPRRLYSFVDLEGRPAHVMERVTPLVHTFNAKKLGEYKTRAAVEHVFLQHRMEELEKEANNVIESMTFLESISKPSRPKKRLELQAVLDVGTRPRAKASARGKKPLRVQQAKNAMLGKSILSLKAQDLNRIVAQLELAEKEYGLRRAVERKPQYSGFLGFLESEAHALKERLLKLVQVRENAELEAKRQAEERLKRVKSSIMIPHLSAPSIEEKIPELVAVMKNALERRIKIDAHLGNWGMDSQGRLVYLDTFEKTTKKPVHGVAVEEETLKPVGEEEAIRSFLKNKGRLISAMENLYGSEGKRLAKALTNELRRQGLSDLQSRLSLLKQERRRVAKD